jgi:hypothetical protein
MSVGGATIMSMDKTLWGISFGLPESFGDTGEQWTQGRAVVWKARQFGATIDPPTVFEGEWPNFGWWLGLVDLLCFGLGVDDVPTYLKSQFWGDNNLESPLERFIAQNWGESAAVLELYLMMHPDARVAIHNYVHMSRGTKAENIPALVEIDADTRMLTGSYAGASIQSPREISLAKALVDPEKIRVEYLREPELGDPAHLSSHFSFLWAESPTEIQPNDTVKFTRSGGAILHLESYAGWYGKLHALRRDCESDQDITGNADSVEVSIASLGSIGTFVFDHERNCFVLEGEERAKRTGQTSPRYGFSLTGEMAEALRPWFGVHDSPEDDPLEYVELQIRPEVDLAHSLTYEIRDPGVLNGDWTRVSGQWSSGFVVPDGKHYKRCAAALIEGSHLDFDVPLHQAVLNDSEIHEVSPWALELITNLWDAGGPVRSLFGRLAGLGPDLDVSVDAVDEETHQQIESYIDSLGKFIPPDSDFLIEELLEWREGLFMTAKDMLTAIVEAESHR